MKTSSALIFASLVLACTTCLVAADAKDPSAKLIAGSNWQGTHEHKGHADPSSSSARLKVAKREGKTFTGDFYLSNPRTGRRGVRVKGEVDAKSGEVRMQPYEIIAGTWGTGKDILEEVWTGSVDDDKLEFQRKNKSGTWDVKLKAKAEKQKGQ
jgi:hypothetical protein